MYSATSRIRAIVALTVAVATGEAACTTTPDPVEPQSTTTPPGMPVIRSCAELVPPEVVAEFDDGYVAQQPFVAAAGTYAAEIAELNGVVCSWNNEASGESIGVAVANPTSDELADREAAAGRSASAFAGYFAADDDSAQAQAFSGPYWIVVDFSFGADEDDMAPFIDSVIDSLAS